MLMEMLNDTMEMLHDTMHIALLDKYMQMLND